MNGGDGSCARTAPGGGRRHDHHDAGDRRELHGRWKRDAMLANLGPVALRVKASHTPVRDLV